MKLYLTLLLGSLLVALSAGAASAQQGYTYSKAVQKACASDYRKHCGQYGIETEALRLCMDRVGRSLSKTCVDALVVAGEVRQTGDQTPDTRGTLSGF